MGNSINDLPDDLLIYIVSLLPVKEAAISCAISKRWRNLWMFSTILQFNGSKFAPKSEDGDRISLELREKENFINFVSRALNSHLSETIDKFSIVFDLYNRNHYHHHYRKDIDRWIVFALRKKVRHLNLHFNPNLKNPFPFGFKPYAFPNIAHGSSSAVLDQSAAFASLVSLNLTRISISGEVVGFFVSNCPLLEVLHLIHVCDLGSVSPKCPAIRLRSLIIFDCKDVTRVEICSPNLVSFEFTELNSSSDVSIVLNGVSSLIYLALEPWVISKWSMGISGCLPRLETLILWTVMPPQHVEEPLLFPNLPRLKRSQLNVGTRDTESLVCFIPLGNSEAFSRAAVAVELVIYMLESAPSLEKMIINGKVVAGEEMDLLKAKLGSPTFAQDITRLLLML